MQAVVIDDLRNGCRQPRLVLDHAEPQRPPGEVRIRTTLTGICNTDLEILRGYAGFQGVPGHEFVGVVDQAENEQWVGQRVVGEINAPCGVCQTCRSGRPTHCPERTALGIRGRNGALAEYFCLPEGNLCPVPEGMPDEVAVFTEPLAAACEVLDQVHVRPTDRVIVLGDGKLGLLVAQVLSLTGCDLLAVGRHPEKLAILTALGIPTRLEDGRQSLSHDDPAQGTGQHAGSRADIVVECTGRAEGFQAARQYLRSRGTLVLKSTYHGLIKADLSGLVVDEIQVVGSRCGPFSAALRLLSGGQVAVTPLIEAEYALHQALAALEHAGRPGTLKVLVRSSSS